MKNKTYRIFGSIIRICFYRNADFKFRVYRNEYPYSNPTKEFEALLFMIGKIGFWIFRNEKIYQEWLNSN